MRPTIIAVSKAGVGGSSAGDGEFTIPITTVSTTLAAAITSTAAVAATLASATGLPAGNFLLAVGTECCLVTARTGTSITAMTRAYNGTTAATYSTGAAVTVLLATPDMSQGAMQKLVETGDVTLLAPINSPGPKTWWLDVQQDATGNWATYPSTGYAGTGPGSAGDPLKWDSTPLMRYTVQFSIRASGNTDVTGGSGPYSI